MWNQKEGMDGGRFVLHQAGWDDKSALGRYDNSHNPDYRHGGTYPGQGYTEPGYPADNGFNRGGFQRDVLLERERYQMAAPVEGAWKPPGSGYDDELGVVGGSRRHAKAGYEDNSKESNDLSDGEIREPEDNHRDFRDVRESNTFRDHEFERGGRPFVSGRHGFVGDDYGHKRSAFKSSREGSWDRDYVHSRYGDEYESDQDEEKRDRSWRKSQRRDRERRRSNDRDESPERGRKRDRSHSRGLEHRSRRSRSSSRGYTRERRDRSYDDVHRRDEKRYRDYSVSASATLVVKGLSQRTVEDDICKALAEWGPLRHVRVIKERNTGTSRGFAFIDFPSVDAAQKMMIDVGDSGLVVDGRRLFFEYSSKPTGGSHADSGAGASTVDWMCTVCGCVNFARRTSCFQCNEARSDDAPDADVSSVITSASGRKGPEAGRTHVLVIRGLDEDVHEEILRYEFSKHAPIKDLRLVRDKFTHVSKGFAFVHFHSVEDATKALEATNGTMLDKNGHPLRVAYAKSTNGPGSSSSAHSNNSLAAAAIEAAGFAQQYDPAGWAPKEYNPDEVQQNDGVAANSNTAPQAGFVWDEASGYYYDAVSGFYYDGHRGLYYDGNHGIWYTYNQETQQYEPYVLKEGESVTANSSSSAQPPNHQKSTQKATVIANATVKSKDATTVRKAVISAPPSTIHVEQDSITKLGVIQKKEKGRKSKTKISGVSSIWSQKQEGSVQTVTVQSPALLKVSPAIENLKRNAVVNENQEKSALARSVSGIGASSASATATATATATIPKKIQGVIHRKQTLSKGSLVEESRLLGETAYNVSAKTSGVAATPKLEGVIHSRDGPTSGGGIVTIPKKFEGVIHSKDGPMLSMHSIGQGTGDLKSVENSFKLINNTTPSTNVGFSEAMDPKGDSTSSFPGGGRRRFTEAPAAPAHSGYRDRAAERRNLYGGS